MATINLWKWRTPNESLTLLVQHRRQFVVVKLDIVC